jgi:transposase
VNSHKNARLGFTGRVCLVMRVVDDGWSGTEAAHAFGVSARTVWKWVRRYRAEGRAGLRDRTARPHRSPRQLAPALEQHIARRRTRRQTGPQIADALGLPLSTVGDVLRRLGLGRLPPLQPRPPVVRYEREYPGELLHIDAKKLGKIHPGTIGHRITGDRAVRGPRQRTGWECLHVAVDDASRVAYAALLPDESAASAVAFVAHAVTWLAGLGVQVERVMTDNAFCYTQRQYAAASRPWASRTSAPGPTRRAPMAKPSASSRPRCASGRTPNRIAPRAVVLARSAPSSHPTTPRARTPHMADDLP